MQSSVSEPYLLQLGTTTCTIIVKDARIYIVALNNFCSLEFAIYKERSRYKGQPMSGT